MYKEYISMWLYNSYLWFEKKVKKKL